MNTAPAQPIADARHDQTCTRAVQKNSGICAATAAAGVLGFLVLWGHAFFRKAYAPEAASFVSTYGAALIVGSPIVILLAVYGWAGIIDAFAWIIRKPTLTGTSARANCQTSDDTLHTFDQRNEAGAGSGNQSGADEAVIFFQVAAAFCLAFGFVATVVGLIVSLANLRSPSQLGPGVAAALLSQMYGVCLAVTCLALAAFIARRHAALGAMKPLARRAATAGGLTLIAGSLTTLIAFGIMMISQRPVI